MSVWSPVLTDMRQHEIAQQTIIEQLTARKTYVSSTEAIGILGITRQTFCLWIRQGKLSALRIGNAYMVDPAHLSAFLRARQVCNEV
jgi:excisionase family DNA binding protein